MRGAAKTKPRKNLADLADAKVSMNHSGTRTHALPWSSPRRPFHPQEGSVSQTERAF
jgi:hypothetical protein